MAEIANAFAESTGRNFTTSTTVGGANKVRLTHTPGDNETWLYVWAACVDSSVATADVLMRLRNETAAADWANVNLEPQDTTNRSSVGGIKVHTYGASPGSQDIDIDYWSEAGSQVGITDARIFGLLLSADDKYAENNAQQNNATTSYVAALTLTDTLNGDYLFLCSCEFLMNAASNRLGIRADKGGAKYGAVAFSPQDATTWRTWATGFKLTGLSGAQTVTIEFAADSAVVQASVRNCRILALKLSRFNKNGYQEDRGRTTNATSTPADKSTLAFLPDATRNHIAIGGMVVDHSSATTNGFAEFERDGAAINQHQEEPNIGGDSCSFLSLRRESLTSGVSTTYKTQFWSETTNTTGAAESWIVVLDLEAATVAPVTGLGLHHIGEGIGDTGVHAGRVPQTLHTIERGIMCELREAA